MTLGDPEYIGLADLRCLTTTTETSRVRPCRLSTLGDA